MGFKFGKKLAGRLNPVKRGKSMMGMAKKLGGRKPGKSPDYRSMAAGEAMVGEPP